jgi:hypothetical protein
MAINRILLSIVIVSGVSSPAFAWGDKGHPMVNRLAAQSLPAEMPSFFRRAVTELAYLGYDPDRWRSQTEPALGAVNPPDHFIDLEYTSGLELPPDRYQFMKLLVERGIVKDDVTLATVGYLPYRIVELAELLRLQFRLWRQTPRQTALDLARRRQIEQNIIFIAGILGHYVADGSQPHHTTVHYNGWNVKFAPNPNGYITEPGIHTRFENDFVNEAIQETEVKRLVTRPRRLSSVFSETIQYLKTTQSRVEPLYKLDKAGGFAPGSTNAQAKRFVAEQLATGAQMLASIWYTAWLQSK